MECHSLISPDVVVAIVLPEVGAFRRAAISSGFEKLAFFPRAANA
jgi:hypothetical protein